LFAYKKTPALNAGVFIYAAFNLTAGRLVPRRTTAAGSGGESSYGHQARLLSLASIKSRSRKAAIATFAAIRRASSRIKLSRGRRRYFLIAWAFLTNGPYKPVVPYPEILVGHSADDASSRVKIETMSTRWSFKRHLSARLSSSSPLT
jgi:hypothetical protein